MRENLQNGLMVLRRKLGPMKALILMELFAALALVLYINGVFSSGSKAEVGGMLLMGFVPGIFAAGAGHIRDSFLLAQRSVRSVVLSDLRGLAAWVPGRTGSSAL